MCTITNFNHWMNYNFTICFVKICPESGTSDGMIMEGIFVDTCAPVSITTLSVL
jgi:hypothetical protein